MAEVFFRRTPPSKGGGGVRRKKTSGRRVAPSNARSPCVSRTFVSLAGVTESLWQKGDIFAVAQHEKRLGAAPKPHYSSAMPPEEPLIQSEIHALLRQAEQGSETVRDLASSCLANFRKECQLALE